MGNRVYIYSLFLLISPQISQKTLRGSLRKKKFSVAKNQPKRVATINTIDRDRHTQSTHTPR